MPKLKPKDEALKNVLSGKKAFESGNSTQALLDLENAYQFYKYTDEHALLAEILRIIGEIYFEKGKMIESRNHYKKAYMAFRNYGHKIGMADCYDKIALSFMLQDEYGHAEDYQIKALKIRENTPDKKGKARGLKNLAIIKFKKSGNEQEAINLLTEAIELAKKSKDPQLVINIATDISKMRNKIGDFEIAMQYAVIARRFSKEYSIKLPDESEEDFTDLLINLGLQKYDEVEYDQALKYLKNASLILKSNNNPMLTSIEETIEKIESLIDVQNQ
ncbi:MAG: tetratricopeptide repeat protein [Candidatus Heimdallarchaeota archaeon]